MNKQETLEDCYLKLNLDKTSSEEEVKKRYRELAKKYHPDNKNTGDTEKFKEITSAYQTILNPPEEDQNVSFGHSPFSGAYPFGRRESTANYDNSNIELYTNISFIESVLGLKKELSFSRKIKCQNCDGNGSFAINNGCTECKGRGQIIRQHGTTTFVSTCPKCFGRAPKQSCTNCSGMGIVSSDITITVNIPGGIKNENILRLSNIGNFAGSFGPFDQHTDVYLHVSVDADTDLSIDNTDVISSINISLLEAVEGCVKTVKTIDGDKEINIPSLSKNKEEIILSRLGVNREGNHRIALNVSYPDNLLDLLKSQSL